MNLIKNRGHKKQTFLCAKYDYKMDIAVKKEEAFQDGMEAGLAKGAQQKAIEASIALLKKRIPPETIAECEQLPLEKVLELKKSIKE